MTTRGRPTVRVLLIDDDEEEHLIVRQLLAAVTTTRFELSWAATYSDGLAQLEAREPDVCLLDYNLGGHTGLEVIAELVRRGSTVPVVMLTARDDLETDASAIGAGATDYLIKSRVDAWVLERTLLHAIDRAAALRARREAELALRRSEERFIKSFYGNPMAMAIESLDDGRLVDVNDAFVRLVGVTRDELFGGWNIRDLWDSAPEHARFVAALRADGRAPGVETALRTRDGTRRTVRVSGETIDVQGKRCCLLVVDDVTQRKQLEARLMLSDRMASIGTLAAGVSHEINNPLAVVVANLELLAADARPADKELIDDARIGAERIRRIVLDLRTFARSEEGRARLVDVRAVAEAAMAMVGNDVRHRARMMKQLGEVPAVYADEAGLGQVFLNLLMNAAQSIREGAADRNEISVATRTEDDGAVVEIRDTGCGIAADVLPYVFDPFFTTRGAFAATGLGLSICHNIVTRLGGRIALGSEPGRGTTVTVWLPARAAADAVATVSPAATEGPASRGRVLVVDDEVAVARAIKRIVTREHDVEIVGSGREALALLSAADAAYDAIICDIMMPDVTGAELFAEVQRRAPALAEQFVFLSGGAFTAEARAFLDGVGNPHLEKPVDSNRLLMLIRHNVRRSGARAAPGDRRRA